MKGFILAQALCTDARKKTGQEITYDGHKFCGRTMKKFIRVLGKNAYHNIEVSYLPAPFCAEFSDRKTAEIIFKYPQGTATFRALKNVR